MVLVDTNIIIDYWKNPDSNMEKVLDNELCAICGVVRTELIRGAVSEKNVHEIINAISEFEYIDFIAEDWDELGKLIYNLRINGISVPLPDAIIAYLALTHDCSVWTRDKHFELIQNVYPKLRLY